MTLRVRCEEGDDGNDSEGDGGRESEGRGSGEGGREVNGRGARTLCVCACVCARENLRNLGGGTVQIINH